VETVRTRAAGAATSADAVLGTYPYMPPEQAEGRTERIDRRSDVFGLGAVLCEILTGQPPYTAATREELIARVKRADLADAFARLDACGADGELVRLTKACLAADPGQRPADAGAAAAAVTGYLAGVQESCGVRSWRGRGCAGRWGWRRWWCWR
jgi:serine/threonine-protein kinase